MALTAAPPRDFGIVLRGWRRQRQLTQLDLAHAAEVSSRHLSFLETGRARPSREMVLHLAEHLDVPVLTALLEEACEHTGTKPSEAEHGPDEVVLPMRLRLGADELTLFSTSAVFGAPREVALDELAIEAFYPADDATVAILKRRDAAG